MKHSFPNTHHNTSAAADITAANFIRLLHPSLDLGKVSFVIIRSRDEAVTKTYTVKIAPAIVDALLDEGTYVSLNRFHGQRSNTRMTGRGEPR